MNPELLKAIDPIVRKVGLYTSYELHESEFVGEVPYAIPGIQYYLPENGYEKPPTFLGVPLQAAKLHPETGDVHDWSYRKVDPENNRKQYHIHGWEHNIKDPTEKYHEIASHWEYRPDVCRVAGETIGEAIERLRTHFKPDWGTSEYQQGKMDDSLRELVK